MIEVEKNIPAGAGLGGGSADAAAVLAGLNELFSAGLPDDALADIGLKIGADVPMCLAGRALRARGIGEEISTFRDWPPLPMVLAWPGRPVSTAAAVVALAEWLAGARNDLEAPALAITPEIGEVLTALRGTESCLLARMSGSGSACFGLYPTRADADAAAKRLGAEEPRWWIAATLAR
jgi:4-diphosphocytidyl-2-C-methyl-D-erythritol kinase